MVLFGLVFMGNRARSIILFWNYFYIWVTTVCYYFIDITSPSRVKLRCMTDTVP